MARCRNDRRGGAGRGARPESRCGCARAGGRELSRKAAVMGLMRVLVTRPEPDARQEADALRARGYEPVLAPLLDIEFLKGVSLDLDGAQAVVITSRNALRALADHPQREAV